MLNLVPGFRAIPDSVTVRIERWLELRQLVGTVTLLQGNNSRSAREGDRLQRVGDGLATGPDSTVTLSVDTGVGFINVSQNTQLRVRSLEYASDNGRITRLEVTQGQARLRVRRFTHSGSQLEIYTPAGVSGVRGTEFGVNVQPDGKMGIATRSGSVYTTAQGATVTVAGGFQNLTIPGQVPQSPVPLRDSTELNYRIEQIIERGVRRLRLVGSVDPVNSVIYEDTPQVIDRNGQFSLLLPALNRLRIQITVITPLGKQQVHELEIF